MSSRDKLNPIRETVYDNVKVLYILFDADYKSVFFLIRCFAGLSGNEEKKIREEEFRLALSHRFER